MGTVMEQVTFGSRTQLSNPGSMTMRVSWGQARGAGLRSCATADWSNGLLEGQVNHIKVIKKPVWAFG